MPQGRGRVRWIATFWSAAIVFATNLGCAPMQRIPLDVQPAAATLFLDGQALETVPEELALRSDRDHKLYFKHEGYHPALIVLITRDEAGEPTLDPPAVRLELEPLRLLGREIKIDGGKNTP